MKFLSTFENKEESILVIGAEEAKIHLLKLLKSSLSESSASLYLGLLESHDKNMKVKGEIAFSAIVGIILLVSIYNSLYHIRLLNWQQWVFILIS